VVACLGVIGVGWSVLIAPGTPPGFARLAAAAGAGLVVATGIATGLAAVGWLRPAVMVGSLVIAAGLPLAFRGVATRRRAVLAMGRRRPAILLCVVGLIALGLAILWPSREAMGGHIPLGTTTWYYVHLSDAVALSGGFPGSLPEWGDVHPFQTDYAAFTAFAAAALQLLPVGLLAQMEALRMAVLILGGLSSVLLFRRWFSTWTALLATIALFGTLRIEQRFLALRPESFAVAVGFLALWLVDRAAVERSARATLAGAAALAIVLLAHAEVFVVLLPLAAGVIVARGLLAWRAGAIGVRPRGIKAVAGRSLGPLLAVAGAVVLGSIVNIHVAGEARLLGYAVDGRDAVAAVPPVPAERIPPGWTLTGDPTWDFNVAAAQPAQAGRSVPTSFTDPRVLPRSILHVWPRLDGAPLAGRVILAALLLTALLLWPWLDARRRQAGVAWLVFGVGLLVGTWLLFERSDTYVPARTGGRRLLPYELFLPVVAVIVVSWCLDRKVLAAWVGRLAGRASPVVRAGLGLVVVLALISSPRPVRSDEGGLTATGWDMFATLRGSLPAGSRILANAYTDGSIGMLSGGVGILDGRAVYLEDPAFLGDAEALVLGARRFFGNPDDPAALDYLAAERVDHLLVVTTTGSGSDIGGYPSFPTDVTALDRSPRFRLVARFGTDRVRLYEVVDPGSPP
jgi:hypothetical protein